MGLMGKTMDEITVKDAVILFAAYGFWKELNRQIDRRYGKRLQEKFDKDVANFKKLGTFNIDEEGESEKGVPLAEYLIDHPNAMIRPVLKDLNGDDNGR